MCPCDVTSHGLAYTILQKATDDVDNVVPFVFKFDETMAKQAKKQYDVYAKYLSKSIRSGGN